MTHPQQTTRKVLEQCVQALNHCMDAITERGLNGSPDQAEKWGLQLPLVRAESAITAAHSMLANPTPSTTWEAPKRVWSASNRTATLLFWTEADARQAAAFSVAAGLEVGSIPVFGNPPKVEPAPSTAGEWDNKTEMLAKLTAWLDGLGGSIHTYSLRGIALAGFEEGWSAALLQSTADHIAQNRKLVAALPVGELPEPFHPSASHINPDYRDGWNAALAAARSQP